MISICSNKATETDYFQYFQVVKSSVFFELSQGKFGIAAAEMIDAFFVMFFFWVYLFVFFAIFCAYVPALAV